MLTGTGSAKQILMQEKILYLMFVFVYFLRSAVVWCKKPGHSLTAEGETQCSHLRYSGAATKQSDL